ncbi:MAG: cysteine--tRNA ligase, partial [Firmicutes bacterium]|nr:cysteine--tRNA ligase [Bacillota bacterium]
VVYNLRDLLPKLPEDDDASAHEVAAKMVALQTYHQRFVDAMDDDFNTADALAVLFDLARETNAYLANPAPSKTVVAKTLAFFGETGDLLGFFADQATDDLTTKVDEMIAQRQTARKAKDWGKADAIRDELQALGIVLEDTPQGIRWRKK